VYNHVVALELAVERNLDRISAQVIDQDPALLDRLTAVVKTFERPRALDRLLSSIRRLYPLLRVIVVDDSRRPVPAQGVRTVVLPFDSGVSAGRREGLRHVTTEYMLVLDDDYVFYRHTDLVRSLRVMGSWPEIDILGGQVVGLPFYTTVDYSRATLHQTEAKPTMPQGSRIGGLPVYDKVPNFIIGRTERVRLIDWTPSLKRMDHTDFFTRAKGVLTTVFDARLKCLHAQTPFDAPYMAYREDILLDNAVLRHRYGDR
jgi:hypothetical protein